MPPSGPVPPPSQYPPGQFPPGGYPPGPAAAAARPRWFAATVLLWLLSVSVAAVSGLFAMVMLMFFDDPSAPGAYAALYGALTFAATGIGSLAVPVLFTVLVRHAASRASALRRLSGSLLGYLPACGVAIYLFGFVMH